MSSPGFSDSHVPVVTVAQLVQSSSFLSCATCTAFLYNLVTSLDDEFDLVWGNIWHAGSALYLLTRYLTAACLCLDLIQAFMRGTFQLGDLQMVGKMVQGLPSEVSTPTVPYFTGTVVLFCSMVLLQLRTAALYGNRKALLVAFGVLDLLALGGCILTDLYEFTPVFVDAGFSSVVWIPFIVLETITFILGMRKSYKSYRQSHGSRLRWSPLLKIIVRDNIIYFVIIFLLYMLGIAMNYFTFDLLVGVALLVSPARYFYNAHFMVSVAFSGFAAARLFINMKKSSMNPTLTVDGHTLTPIRFQAVPQAQRSTLTGDSSQVEEYSMETIR